MSEKGNREGEIEGGRHLGRPGRGAFPVIVTKAALSPSSSLLIPCSCQTWSRWHGRQLFPVFSHSGTSLCFSHISNSLRDVWRRRCSAAFCPWTSGHVQAGAAHADQALQPERRISPEDFTRWKCEWREEGQWHVWWEKLNHSFPFVIDGSCSSKSGTKYRKHRLQCVTFSTCGTLILWMFLTLLMISWLLKQQKSNSNMFWLDIILL